MSEALLNRLYFYSRSEGGTNGCEDSAPNYCQCCRATIFCQQQIVNTERHNTENQSNDEKSVSICKFDVRKTSSFTPGHQGAEFKCQPHTTSLTTAQFLELHCFICIEILIWLAAHRSVPFGYHNCHYTNISSPSTFSLRGACSNSEFMKAFRLKKQAVQVLAKLKTESYVDCRPAFNKLKLLALTSLTILEITLFCRSKCSLMTRRQDVLAYENETIIGCDITFSLTTHNDHI